MSKLRVVAEPIDNKPPTKPPSLSDEELEQALLEELPTEPPGTSLQILWEATYPDSAGSANDVLKLIDVRTGYLYGLSVDNDQNIVIYPIETIERSDFNNGYAALPGPDGKPNWADIYTKYFPNGFAEPEKAKKEVVAATACFRRTPLPDNFWRKTLAKLLEGYLPRKVCKNPYKKNKH